MSIHMVGSITAWCRKEAESLWRCSTIWRSSARNRDRSDAWSGCPVSDSRRRAAAEVDRAAPDGSAAPGRRRPARSVARGLPDLEHVVLQRRAQTAGGPRRRPRTGSIQVYLICDSRDADRSRRGRDVLFEDFEVILRLQRRRSGPAARPRRESAQLRWRDDPYGAGNEPWLRRKLAELQKSAGYGRTKPMPEVAVCVIPPETPESTASVPTALVVPQWEGAHADRRCEPFVRP